MILARIYRYFWLMKWMWKGWIGYDVYDYRGHCTLIGAILLNTPPRKGEPETLRVFWTNV